MKFEKTIPPRRFVVGKSKISISDTASIFLQDDEQVTFKTDQGAEYDVCRKNWGYYATPSINGRLSNFGYKTALVKNEDTGMLYVMLVEKHKIPEFQGYLDKEALILHSWLA
tara:strand:- start:7175 stop:7510 length:336 start_codon:yes stop_codon:yes gene_type:complete